ncbi:MAG: chromosome partitioning protein, partial [Candidatus Eisenbacteria bacterium]|nr:chromosome partitioning protein [Candidatus Eisenbacteria bacterium]
GPAILESPEATDFATLADGVVLVVRAGHTKRPVVARAVDLLRKSGARVLGTVLNRRRLEIPDFLYRRI